MIREGIEVWRGGVDPWECDTMGHMNVRFYVARATEGLAGLAAALGMPRAFTARTPATLEVRAHHIRFVREARAGDALHMTAGVLELEESEALVLFVLRHSGSGAVAAAIQARVAHVTPELREAFPWPGRIRTLADSCRIEVPDEARPRSLSPDAPHATGDLQRARELMLPRVTAGAVGPQDCDVFGRLRPEGVMARISDGFAQWAHAGRTVGPETAAGARIGAAAVEMRLAYPRLPHAGELIDMRSGLAVADERTQTIVHWLLDPVSGNLWASAEHVVVALDLDARRMFRLPAELVQRMRALVTPGLAL